MGRSYTAREPRKSYKYSATIWRLDRSIGGRHMFGKNETYNLQNHWMLACSSTQSLTAADLSSSRIFLTSHTLQLAPILPRSLIGGYTLSLMIVWLLNPGEIKGWVDEGNGDGDKTKTLELDIIPTVYMGAD